MTEDFINAIVSCGEIIPNEKSKLVRHVTSLQYCKKGFDEAKLIKEMKHEVHKENSSNNVKSVAANGIQNQEMVLSSLNSVADSTISADEALERFRNRNHWRANERITCEQSS